MIDDRETERRLEDWLHAEARSMPQDVLEASIEAVARTGQVSAQRPAILRWLGDRRLVAVGAVAAVFAIAVALTPRLMDRSSAVPGAAPGDQWDPAVDFLPALDHSNPSPDRYGNADVWSYMRSASDSHDPKTYVLLPHFVVEGTSDTWYDERLVSLAVGHIQDRRSVWFHPWSSGVRSENHHAILRWRSPVSGTVEVTGNVDHGEPTCRVGTTDGTTFFIDREGESLDEIGLEPGGTAPFETTVDVDPGVSLYFVVDPGRASNCDTTHLTLLITQVAAEP